MMQVQYIKKVKSHTVIREIRCFTLFRLPYTDDVYVPLVYEGMKKQYMCANLTCSTLQWLEETTPIIPLKQVAPLQVVEDV